MATQVLFIAGTAHAQWGGVLQEALGANCIVNPATPCDYANRIRKNRFDLIIIDAGELDYFAEIVHDVQQLQPDVKVIVATASPTWQRAREAMRAGAFDYIRKDQKKSRLARYLHTVLEK